ncbi:unnamed protein product [Mucor circinelloides]
MASHHRSGSRHRSPSPGGSSSKRQRHSYRDRSRSRDRHRSSSHRHHRSSRYEDSRHDDSRYDDRAYHSSSSSSRRHYDNKHTTSSSHDSPATPNSASSTTTAATTTDAEEALRKKQERVRKWKEAKRLKEEEEAKKKAALQQDEDEKKKLAIAAAQKEAEELRLKQEQKEALEKQQREEAEKSQASKQEPQLLQQFAAMRKAAAEAAAKEEAESGSKEDADMDEAAQQENADQESETNGKKWSFDDESESDDDSNMDVDGDEKKKKEAEAEAAKAAEEAERTFKPLQSKNDDNKDEDSILSKPKKTFLMSNKSTKPKNAMRMGFGLGKSMMTMKKSTTPAATATATATSATEAMEVEKKSVAPEPVDTEMKDSEDIDPLEAYMLDVHAETRKINEEDKKRMVQMKNNASNKRRGSIVEDDDEDVPSKEGNADDEEDIGSDPEDILALAAKKVKRKDIAPVDHSKMDYEFFRKDFYIEPPELKEMTQEQVELLRLELDGIKIRGVHCPKPITKWTHCGLPAGCLEVIRKLKYEKPTSIQAQAIPAIMNGRDVIGVAKTGSGKTIAFLLPMFRHIKDQRPLEAGEGPIAIIMTPTRELATQIHRECKPFLKILNLRAVCAYGGSPIKDQIADLKRGCEIIVCTPGRMIDLLCANSGRVTNLRRVTYLVMDEADRMFDMGFEPQVMKIVNNVRPSRQTVLFSATFPRQMEALARKVLKKPLEITVGGRSVVCDDVNQIVEVREDDTKFVRLLEILGELYNNFGEEGASALIFVDRHEAADNLLRDLMRRGYPCQSLHGGKDQADRDSTIADFKSGVTNILIATSVAARGLDVKNLKVVINYECPNHMEDYVHRVGRTGRAGNKGTAYTFITPDQDRYAMDICKALKLSGQAIPPDLQALSDSFQNKVKEGKERASGSGFGGKGLERLDKDRDLVKKFQKKAYGNTEDDSDEEEIELESTVVAPGITAAASAAAAAAKTALEADSKKDSNGKEDAGLSAAAIAAKKAAAMVAARINALGGAAGSQMITEDGETRPVYAEEITINDYPQKARWRVTNKEQINQITEVSGAAITTRGSFFPPGKQPTGNERKLYLFIEGDSEMVVEKAKNEIKRILVEATAAQMEAEARGGGPGGSGRYQVV